MTPSFPFPGQAGGNTGGEVKALRLLNARQRDGRRPDQSSGPENADADSELRVAP